MKFVQQNFSYFNDRCIKFEADSSKFSCEKLFVNSDTHDIDL